MTAFTRSCGSLSWIDPRTGLPEVDDQGHPGATTTRSVIVGEVAYRFSNFLEARIEVNDEGDRITGTAFTAASGMYRSPSFAGLSSDPVGRIGRFQQTNRDHAIFRQVVGCRTASPETIGTGVGAVAGAALLVASGPVGWIAGGVVGSQAGREVAELVTAFPPIWTELELRINLDGSITQRMISSSLFPSCTFYRQNLLAGETLYHEVSNYNAIPSLDRWKEHGWGSAADQRRGPSPGNPWNMVSGRFSLGGHSVNRPCPSSYSCR